MAGRAKWVGKVRLGPGEDRNGNGALESERIRRSVVRVGQKSAAEMPFEAQVSSHATGGFGGSRAADALRHRLRRAK